MSGGSRLIEAASGANAGFVNFWKERIFASDCITIYTNDAIKIKYIYFFLKAHQKLMYSVRPQQAGQPHFYKDDLLQFPIPDIPREIQEKIVAECEQLDCEYAQTRMTIEEYRLKITQLFENLRITMGVIRKIAELGEIRMCRRIMKHQTTPIGDIPFYKIGTFGGTVDAFISREIFDSYRSQYPYPQKGQVLLSAAGTIGRSVIFDGSDSYYQDSNIVWIDTDESVINNRFLHYCFKYAIDWEQYKTSGSVISRLYNDDLRAISIPFPSMDVQNSMAQQIEYLESRIFSMEVELAKNDKRKVAIINKYIYK